MRSLYNNGYSAHLKEAGTVTATLYRGGRQQTDGAAGPGGFPLFLLTGASSCVNVLDNV